MRPKLSIRREGRFTADRYGGELPLGHLVSIMIALYPAFECSDWPYRVIPSELASTKVANRILPALPMAFQVFLVQINNLLPALQHFKGFLVS